LEGKGGEGVVRNLGTAATALESGLGLSKASLGKKKDGERVRPAVSKSSRLFGSRVGRIAKSYLLRHQNGKGAVERKGLEATRGGMDVLST